MMKIKNIFPVGILSLISFTQIVTAADLVIEPGTEYLIDKAQQVLNLNSLTVGDDASINFAEDVAYWSLNASKVVIGNNVRINGRGKKGLPGKDGISWKQKENCGDGQDGGSGENGLPGSDAINITLNLGIAKLGHLTIDANGGEGGQGGDGGKGEDAGFGKICLRAHGGSGGNSGAGGDGGSGGDIRLVIWSNDVSVGTEEIISRIDTSADFGVGGASGEIGYFGQGSPSQQSNIPTVTGGRRRTPAGKDGSPGEGADTGKSGTSGSVSISTVSRPSSLTTKIIEQTEDDSQTQSSEDGEIDALKDQIEALQKRLEQLEQH